MHDRIIQHFSDSIDAKIRAAETLPAVIADAAEMIVQALLSEGKVMACGNGGAAGDAQHFVAELLNRFERERPSLPAIALCADTQTLTAIASEHHFSDIYAKQIRGLGQEGDVLLAITADGNCANIIQAIQAAHDRNMQIVVLSGGNGGDIAELLQPDEIEIRAPDTVLHRIQEVHMVVIHCLCDLIDEILFSGD